MLRSIPLHRAVGASLIALAALGLLACNSSSAPSGTPEGTATAATTTATTPAGAATAAAAYIEPSGVAAPPVPGAWEVPAEQDVAVDADQPTSTFADGERLELGGDGRRALLRFTIDGVPAGGVITSARLRLTPVDGPVAEGPSVHAVVDGWDGEAVTWRTAPAVGETLGRAVGGSNPVYLYADVTSAIREGGAHALYLVDDEGSSAIWSSESLGEPPTLDLTWSYGDGAAPASVLSSVPGGGGAGEAIGIQPSGPLSSVFYRPTSEVLLNPERGLYVLTSSGSLSGGYHYLDPATLIRYREDGSTLVFRYFMLGDYVHSDIAPGYLAAMYRDFYAARRAGVKIIVRFSYTNTFSSDQGPFGDASKSQILRHIQQLGPVLSANQDVVAVVQAGFIGVWGEWAYSDAFGSPEAEAYPDRQDVLRALLGATPADRFVQVRTPRYKYAMDLTLGEAARVGFHNDCFLRGDSDGGTYLADQIAEEKAYVARETLRVPLGGETCIGPNARSADALAELEAMHWSYLNGGFHQDQIAQWRANGDLNVIERELGNSQRLVRGVYSSRAVPGGVISVNLIIQNDGWAAPYNPRLVEVVLRNVATGQEHRLRLDADPTTWEPDSAVTIDEDLSLPPSVGPGSYDLFLRLPDPIPSLYNRPEFSIRLANANLWEPSTGYHRLLQRLTVR